MNLAKFVTLYKTLLLVQKKMNGGKARSHDTFFAGLLGGYVVFGDRTAINEQVRHSLSSGHSASNMCCSYRSCCTSARALSRLSCRVGRLHVLHRHPVRLRVPCLPIRVTSAPSPHYRGV